MGETGAIGDGGRPFLMPGAVQTRSDLPGKGSGGDGRSRTLRSAGAERRRMEQGRIGLDLPVQLLEAI